MGIADTIEGALIAIVVLGGLALLIWSRLTGKKVKDLVSELTDGRE